MKCEIYFRSLGINWIFWTKPCLKNIQRYDYIIMLIYYYTCVHKLTYTFSVKKTCCWVSTYLRLEIQIFRCCTAICVYLLSCTHAFFFSYMVQPTIGFFLYMPIHLYIFSNSHTYLFTNTYVYSRHNILYYVYILYYVNLTV